MKCYRWILHIQWQQKVRNEEMKRVGANRNVFQIIIQRKLQFFGHICRMKDARMLKAIVFGMMEGSCTERETMSRMGLWFARDIWSYRNVFWLIDWLIDWTDDITDWCKEDLHTLRWKATERADWQRVVRHAIDTNGSPRPYSQRRSLEINFADGDCCKNELQFRICINCKILNTKFTKQCQCFNNVYCWWLLSIL